MTESIFKQIYPEPYSHLNHYKPAFSNRHHGKLLIFSLPIDYKANRGRYFSYHPVDHEEGIFESGVYVIQTDREMESMTLELLPEDKSWPMNQDGFLFLCSLIPKPEKPPSPKTLQLVEKHPSNPGPFPNLSLDNLTLEVREYICQLKEYDFFWSKDPSPEFYRGQAKLGFIAISSSGLYNQYLFPQLQQAYAVLFWEDLTYDNHVKSRLRKVHSKDLPITFEVKDSIEEVIQELGSVRGSGSWLTPMYVALLEKLASVEERQRDPSFCLWSTMVRWDGIPVAGELGYTIGGTYTSLSGFFHRENRHWNHLGKLQMVLLANHLNQSGIKFWNLGHPHMNYKKALGAKILDRLDFLSIWDKAIQEPPADLSTQP